MPPLEGVVPTLTPQGVGKGDRPKWHGDRAGERVVLALWLTL